MKKSNQIDRRGPGRNPEPVSGRLRQQRLHGLPRPRHPPTVLFTARWTRSRRMARSTSAFSLTRTRSAMSMKTASIRAMTSTLPTAWPRIWRVKVNYVSTEAANRIEYLQTGKVDVILANFTVTPERAEEVGFCAALHERCPGRRFPGLQRHHVAGQLERR